MGSWILELMDWKQLHIQCYTETPLSRHPISGNSCLPGSVVILSRVQIQLGTSLFFLFSFFFTFLHVTTTL